MEPFNQWLCALYFLLPLQIIASIIRYSVRAFLVKKLGLDDLMSFITLVRTIARHLQFVAVTWLTNGQLISVMLCASCTFQQIEFTRFDTFQSPDLLALLNGLINVSMAALNPCMRLTLVVGARKRSFIYLGHNVFEDRPWCFPSTDPRYSVAPYCDIQHYGCFGYLRALPLLLFAFQVWQSRG